jgi:hypothetical protein
MNWIQKHYKANPHDAHVVEVTGNGCLDPDRFGPKNVADVEGKTVFVSLNAPNQWISYDFKTHRVKLTHYAIRSRFDGIKGSNNPKNWVVEGSEDGSHWIMLDSKCDNHDLNGGNITKVWDVHSNTLFRCVRLRQTAVAHSGKLYLVISSFELFGSLIDPVN